MHIIFSRLFFSLVAVSLICGCTAPVNDSSSLADPSALYCEEQGFVYTVREKALGSYGVCVFSEIAECPAWEYFNNKCSSSSAYTLCSDEEKLAEVCTLEYSPVCGDNAVTYGNICTACSSGEVTSYRIGDCSSDVFLLCSEDLLNAEVCTLEYSPVCGDNSISYSNACQACASGNVTSYIIGECIVKESLL